LFTIGKENVTEPSYHFPTRFRLKRTIICVFRDFAFTVHLSNYQQNSQLHESCLQGSSPAAPATHFFFLLLRWDRQAKGSTIPPNRSMRPKFIVASLLGCMPSYWLSPSANLRRWRGVTFCMSDVTRILERVEHGDGNAAEELLPLV